MQIEKGRKYLDRKGRVWGPAIPAGDLSKPSEWAWREAGWEWRLEMKEGHITTMAGFRRDGTRSNQYPCDEDLVAIIWV